jgi:hypothetical protein
MNPTVKRVWKIITVLMGLAVVAAPDILGLSAWLATKGAPWAVYAGKAVAAVYLLVTNWERIKARIEPLVGAVPQSPAPATVTEIRPPDRGCVRLGFIAVFDLALIATALAILLFGIRLAKAETGGQFGGCVSPTLCLGPSATVTVGQFDFSSSKFSGGIMPGLGYGATYAPSSWYATGAALYMSFLVGQGQPNQAIPSLMLSFANYVRIGVGVAIVEQDSGPVKTSWKLLFGLGSDLGGSPAYVQAVAK